MCLADHSRAGRQSAVLSAAARLQMPADPCSDTPHLMQITSVGRLVLCKEVELQTVFVLDDNTGKLEVCHWTDMYDGDKVWASTVSFLPTPFFSTQSGLMSSRG